MIQDRVTRLNSAEARSGPVVYWMSRDQRVHDNWALLYGQELALKQRQELIVVFCVVPEFLDATTRQYGFMHRGLKETEEECGRLGVRFHLLTGDPPSQIIRFCEEHRVGSLVTDFDPLRIKKEWKQKVLMQAVMPVYEVDSHNIVPCWVASQKLEFGAYTLRPKLMRLLSQYLQDIPKMLQMGKPIANDVDWRKASAINAPEVNAVDAVPGAKAGHARLRQFISVGLSRYSEESNDPNADATSGLSPYIHFGQISAQRVAMEIMESNHPIDVKERFLEQLVVRRELSDNFCNHQERYDSVEGFWSWARESLAKHARDLREHKYSLKEFEGAKTHDALWNAAQLEMVKTGRMHGYMRMYWAKKILEWTVSAEQAMRFAVYLNDRYMLDGRDPNGYTGIAWSMRGVHDRPWMERPVFGKIRYMNHSGCRRKFDVDSYIAKIDHL